MGRSSDGLFENFGIWFSRMFSVREFSSTKIRFLRLACAQNFEKLVVFKSHAFM